MDRFASAVGETRCRRFIQSAARLALDDRVLSVSVPNTFYADWLGRRYGEALREAARAETCLPELEVNWRVDPEAFVSLDARRGTNGEFSPVEAARAGADTVAAPNGAPKLNGGPDAMSTVKPGTGRAGGNGAAGIQRARKNTPHPGARSYSLNGFVVGPCNRLAYDAVCRLTAPESNAGFNVLFVHSGCGLGKTHLLQGAARAYRKSHPGAKVRCTTGEAFANEYIASIRNNTLESFRRRHRSLDLLCIDDVHFIAGKNATQSEFLHTFDALDLTGAKVMLASDGHPREIAQLNARLVSRCLSGMVVGIDAPDEETRRRLIVALASRQSLRLEPEAIEYVGRACRGSVRELEGAMTRLAAMHALLPDLSGDGAGIGLALVRASFSQAGHAAPSRPIQIDAIGRAVCAAVFVDVADMLGRSRHQRVVLARSLTCYLARRLTTQSFPEIAASMGRSNHSTIVTACQRIERQLVEDAWCDLGPSLGRVRLVSLCERLTEELCERGAAAA